MSAQANPRADHDAARAVMNREAERCSFLVHPLLPVAPRRVWDMDSWALPVPRLAYDYVRDAVEWRLVVHAAINHLTANDGGAAARRERRAAYRRFLAVLMFRGPDADEVARAVLAIFPPARCANARCGNWYFPYTRRLRHCSEECRRATGWQKEREQRRGVQ